MGRGEHVVPSKDYAAQYRELLPELLPELGRVLLEEDPILGDSVVGFEREFAAHAGAAHGVGVNSGTDALCLALRAAGIGAGGEVITNAATFMATVSAIVMAGAKPVLLDPDPGTLNLAEDAVLAALSPRTSAVIVVHLHGRLAPTARLTEACRTGGVAVLEDAAQAHGARGADGRRAGALGLAGCFSFHPSKNLGAFGDAGMITTSDRSLAGRLAVLRNLGKTGKYEFGHVAPNSKLDTLQAAILRVKLRRLDAWNAHRRVLAAAYREQLAGTGDLVLPPDPGGESHVWHQFAVRTGRREDLRGFLGSAGIRAGMHYPIPPHLQRLDLDLGYRRGDLPVTEEFARTCLSLPISHELGLEHVGTVCERIRRFFRG